MKKEQISLATVKRMATTSAVIDRMKSRLGITYNKELADALGVSTGAIGNWKARGTIPIDECLAFCESHNVSLDWLVRGRGPEESFTNAIDSLATAVELNEYISRYSQILIYDIEASAGSGRLFDDELVETTIQFDTEQLQRDGLDPAQVVGVRVRGDSMGETLHDGDRVLVDRSSRTPDGVFLLRMDDGLRIKRVQRVAGGGWMLISDNARYQPELVDPLSNQNVEIIGECVMRIGRIA
ncbi:LexA family transcriptional regulator [Kushneria phyllosphaerae]|uniref:HTH-type transcriptional regulator PrtR n=1 Tax=Kushneria phyllosphaerae TaxID=2100822 RepID=A0A2R8CQX8_9GAMM|nr:S24 family peptidase [Kushneria phyllosphaerae]SPJ35232.1 HTH-type transcriptional regulator PrtR [Kushneria phyllosphaerae]